MRCPERPRSRAAEPRRCPANASGLGGRQREVEARRAAMAVAAATNSSRVPPSSISSGGASARVHGGGARGGGIPGGGEGGEGGGEGGGAQWTGNGGRGRLHPSCSSLPPSPPRGMPPPLPSPPRPPPPTPPGPSRLRLGTSSLRLPGGNVSIELAMCGSGRGGSAARATTAAWKSGPWRGLRKYRVRYCN